MPSTRLGGERGGGGTLKSSGGTRKSGMPSPWENTCLTWLGPPLDPFRAFSRGQGPADEKQKPMPSTRSRPPCPLLHASQLGSEPYGQLLVEKRGQA